MTSTNFVTCLINNCWAHLSKILNWAMFPTKLCFLSKPSPKESCSWARIRIPWPSFSGSNIVVNSETLTREPENQICILANSVFGSRPDRTTQTGNHLGEERRDEISSGPQSSLTSVGSDELGRKIWNNSRILEIHSDRRLVLSRCGSDLTDKSSEMMKLSISTLLFLLTHIHLVRVQLDTITPQPVIVPSLRIEIEPIKIEIEKWLTKIIFI